jgi:hypothetical protein
MALFLISIPLMSGAVAIAVVPLLAMSRAQHRTVAAEADVLVRFDAACSPSSSEEPAQPLAA